MEKQHAFKIIEKDLKEGRIGNPVFLFGGEQYLVGWAKKLLLRKYINPASEMMDKQVLVFPECGLEALKLACETLPFLSARRVVIVELETEPAAEEDAALCAYIGMLPETCLLVFTAKKADKRRKLYTTIQKTGSVYEFGPLDETALRAFIDKRLRAAGKSARPSVIKQIVDMSGYFHKESEYTLFNLENDLQKIAAMCEGATVTSEAAAALVAGDLETDVFAMIDAAGKNRKETAFRLLFNLMTTGDSVYRILAVLCAQLEIMLEVRQFTERGMRMPEIQRITGVNEYRLRKAGEAAVNRSVAGLAALLSRAYETDRNIKNGSVPQEMALELLVAAL